MNGIRDLFRIFRSRFDGDSHVGQGKTLMQFSLEVFDDADPVGKSDPKSISIKILPDDYQASDNYFLSARAVDTKEVNFTLENDAISCFVNVSFDPRMGFAEECSASVWLENPYGDIIMNETVTLPDRIGVLKSPPTRTTPVTSTSWRSRSSTSR